jgi:fibronectin type III domain protein
MHSFIRSLVLAGLPLLLSPSASFAGIYYLSPQGSDTSSAGLSESTPWKTFRYAFSLMSPGDELVLLDGQYSDAAGTGYISSDACAGCGQPPSGIGQGQETVIRAKTPGNVTITGRLTLGTQSASGKEQYIRIQGVTFEGGGNLYNTSHVTISGCGFHATDNGSGNVFAIGTIEHNYHNTYDLIEDCWIWGRDRLIAINYRSDFNVWRRVVLRGDGCNSSSCQGGGNPNVGLSIYNSSGVSIQNVLVLDRVLDSGQPYGDFATAQHAPSPSVDEGAGEYLGPNEWLGCLSLSSEDTGYYFEADSVNPNTHRLINVIAWNDGGLGLNIGKNASNVDLENITLGNSHGGDNLRVAPEVQGGTVRNIIAYKAGRYGVNSSVAPSYSDVSGAAAGNYNQTSCSAGCLTTDPLTGSPAPLKYILRIEDGSSLKGTGYAGADYGANVVKRYGNEGSRYGDSGYDVLTAQDLWPWPNQDRIRSEMCGSTARGFCGSSWASLTDYVWRQLGSAPPGFSTSTAPGAPTNVSLTQPTSSSLTATWTAATGGSGVAGYRLDASTDPAFSSFVAGYQNKDLGNVTQTVLSGLNPQTSYTVRLRAYDSAGAVSANSATASGTTLADSTGCLTATYPTDHWLNQGIPAQSGTFTAVVSVTPSAPAVDAAVSLSNGPQTSWSALAATVLFYTDGLIKAIDGGGYTIGGIPYSAGTTYQIRMVLDASNHTYSVYVTPAGGSEQVLGTNLRFRSALASVTSLDNWNVAADAGSLTACGFRIAAMSCTLAALAAPGVGWSGAVPNLERQIQDR